MDVRKIWSYHYNIQQNNDITTKMSDEWENICAELDNQNNEMSMATIKERTERISKDIQDYNNNVVRENLLSAPVKNNQQNNEYNKPMTVEEKNKLGNNIRSLNKEQLKGIIRILSENAPNQKAKYFEFDIDQLSNKKLRELEKYVKDCLSSTKNNKNTSSNSYNNHNKNLNNKTGYQKESQNNKSNNKGNNAQNLNQDILKTNSKIENKNQDNKVEQSTNKKINQSNKKEDKKNDSLSDSDSMSSDSSISN